jgi:hypothetical protein
MKKNTSERFALVLSLSSMALAMGCQAPEPDGSDQLSACETSHQFKILHDDLAGMVRYLQDKAALKSPVDNATIESAHAAVEAKLAADLSSGFKHDMYVNGCVLSGRTTQKFCEIDYGYDGNQDFDFQPVYYSLEYGARAAALLAEKTLSKTEEVCVAGPQYQQPPGGGSQLVDVPCVSKVPQVMRLAGYEQAKELQTVFSRLMDVVGDARSMEFYASTPAQLDEVAKKLELLKSNGIATYLAVQCAQSEAFALLGGGGKKVLQKYSPKNPRASDAVAAKPNAETGAGAAKPRQAGSANAAI